VFRRIFNFFYPTVALENIEQRLRLYLQVTSLLTLTGLIRLLWVKLDLVYYFGTFDKIATPSNWLKFGSEEGFSAALAAIVILVWYNFTRNCRAEVEVMARMFSPSRTPQRWDRVHGQRQLFALVALWIAIVFVLVWSVDHPRFFSIFIMIYSINNVVGMKWYRKDTKQYLSNDSFLPGSSDPHRKIILERRKIQSAYLKKPHHWKEAGLFLCGLAGLLTTWPNILPFKLSDSTPLIILIAGLSLNELIVTGWRRERGRALMAVESEQIRADKARMPE
jgi:hypothetical protein